jgi:hypothetical protein
MANTFELELPRDLGSPGLARRQAADFLADHCPADRLSDVLVVVSELVTNAVIHTGHGCTLVLDPADDHIVVEVHDADTFPARAGRDHEILGNGLGVVQSVARRWGVERLATGKCVWAEIDLVVANSSGDAGWADVGESA